MKKILLAITLLFALPVLASAEENVGASSEAAPKEHHMRNTGPTPTEPQEQVKEQAPPAHVMRNSSPAPKQAQEQDKEQEQEQEQAPEHTMKNN